MHLVSLMFNLVKTMTTEQLNLLLLVLSAQTVVHHLIWAKTVTNVQYWTLQMTNLKFVHHESTRREPEWYEVLYNSVQVLTIKRQDIYPFRWLAIDVEGKQCFEPNQYRYDLFDEIKFEGEFK